MVPIGQTYRAVGSFSLRSILSTFILGVTAALIAALVVWAWEISPIPTFVIFTAIGQGLVVGGVLAFAIGRLKLRNVWVLTIMGFFCGLLSVAMVHFSHHLQFVSDFAVQMRAEVQANKMLTPEERTEILTMIDQDPSKALDIYLLDRTGYGGPIGSLILRNQAGMKIKQTEVTGEILWALWGVEAFVVALTAAGSARFRSSKPFCEECHEWCVEKPGAFALPGESGRSLSNALVTDDRLLVVDLLKNPVETVGNSYSGTKLHSCPSCDQTFADVWLRTDHKKWNKTETTTKNLVALVRVSPEMTALLRNEPAADVEEVIEDEGDATPTE